MTEQRQHAYTTETEEPNPAPETSYAERARTILSLNQVGVLSTNSNKCEGFPFGSTMPYALDDAGRPLFLISAMAMHTKNTFTRPCFSCWTRLIFLSPASRVNFTSACASSITSLSSVSRESKCISSCSPNRAVG